jgi:hypothetical protein
MWETVERLSTLRRQAGTEDERRAAEYIVERLREGGVTVDRWDPEVWVTHPEDASVRVVSPVEEPIGEGSDRPVLKPQSWSPNATATAEVVHVEVPEVSVEEFRNLTLDDMIDEDQDIEGKVVVVGKQILSGRIAREAEDRGAVAYIAVHPHQEEAHQRAATPIWGTTPTPEQAHLLPGIPLLTAAAPVGDRIAELLEEHGSLELEVSTTCPREWTTVPVVVAKVPAETNPTGDFVLLHGHYDSIEFGVTDNATGNAGMIEVARVLNDHRDRLDRDLWVGFWPAHERLYAGSTWFVDEFAHEFMDGCVAHVNFDSPGAKDATQFEEYVSWMPEADELCRSAIRDVAGKDSVENRARRAGDYSFYNIGISGMMALCSSIPKPVREERGYHTVSGSGGNSEAWHLTTDTLDKADPDVLERDTRIYLTIVARLLGRDVVPLDYRRNVRKGREAVEGYDEAAGDHFDLEPVLAAFDGLGEELEGFYAALESGDIEPAVANETLREISRCIVPIDFVEGGRFEQDLMTQRPSYPTLEPATDLPDLDGDEYRFRRVALRRARNAVSYELKRARRLAAGAR